MYYEAELVLKSYRPLELEEGMLFVNKIARTDVVELFILEELPDDEEKFIVAHGYPVELYIVQNEIALLPVIFATPEQIGWWDDDDSEDFREITIEEINNVINEFNGWIEIYIDDEEEDSLPDGWTVDRIDGQPYKPLLIEGRVILRYLTDEEDEEEEY